MTDEQLRESVRQLLLSNVTEGYSRLLQEDYCYIKPAKNRYPFQYFWDTCFHVFMLCALNEHEQAKQNMRSLFQMQRSDGFVGHMIFWQSVLPTKIQDVFQAKPVFPLLRPRMSSLIQPPLVAQSVKQIYLCTKDKDFVYEMVPLLKKYLRWVATNRDFEGDGLISLITPFESGIDYKPSYAFCSRKIVAYLKQAAEPLSDGYSFYHA